MPAFALTIFTGAFLLFQVQPLIGKYILPWFGGGPGVWTTCLLFFQLLLLGGYSYAHLISERLALRRQVLVHLGLVVSALALLPIVPGNRWKPAGAEHPALHIFVLLLATVGLPYFVLSATGPLLQSWFRRFFPARSPYRLYALSNAGSLLALISYPFYFESHFTRHQQAVAWGWGLAVYAACCAWCGMKLRKIAPEQLTAAADVSQPDLQSPSLRDRALWLLWPASATILLLAITNKICQDVAVVPFLWVLPLALYLLSFIICFDNPRWYSPFPFTLLLIAALAGICWALFKGTNASIRVQVGVYSAGLFICCMVCHGEVYRLRPPPRHLTAFYLMIAAGGALGGIFVALVAPLLFRSYYEMHLGLFLCALLFTLARSRRSAEKPSIGSAAAASVTTGAAWCWLACILTVAFFAGLDWALSRVAAHSNAQARSLIFGLRIGVLVTVLILVGSWVARLRFREFRHWRLLACAWLWVGVLGLGAGLGLQARKVGPDTVYMGRNFYGVLTVYEHHREQPIDHHFLLQHGRITHGLQFADPPQSTWHTSYYGEQSGIGLAVAALPPGLRRFGLVGLGTGTFTSYGQAGDYVRIYEINPEVQHIARTWFKYVPDCLARVDVVLGDARLSMEREPPQDFDLLALDAFSSDAIPVHLLTREAFALYDRHLKANGIIAVHISNHYLDLEPVVANLAREFHFHSAIIDYDDSEDDWWLYSCTWILLTRDETIVGSPAIRWAATPARTNMVKVPLWTDDFTSLFPVLK